MSLPPGWSTATLPDLIGRLGEFTDGDWVESKDQDPAGDVRLVQLADVGDGRYLNKSARFLTADKAAELGCTFLCPGDVLVARMPDPLGRACIFPGDPKRSVTVVDVCVLRTGSPEIEHRWLMHALNTPPVRASIAQLASGTTRSRISRSNLATIELPVPPTREQRRIVAQLETLLGRGRRAKEALDAVPMLLKRFRQSVLAAAFRGDLTHSWREEHQDVEPASKLLERIRVERRQWWEDAELKRLVATGKPPRDDRWKSRYPRPEPLVTLPTAQLPQGWLWTSLAELLLAIEAGASPKTDGTPATGSQKGVLKVSAVTWGRFDPTENKALPTGYPFDPALALRKDDLLISRANTVELVGAVVLVGEDHPNLMLSDKTLRLIPVPLICREFLLSALRTSWVRAVFEDDATGTSDSMRNLSQPKILSAPVALAPLSEQQEIARQISNAMTHIQRVEAVLAEATSRLPNLEEALLEKAFRGELVPQDPADEPASALLERIRAERSSPETDRATTAKRRETRVA